MENQSQQVEAAEIPYEDEESDEEDDSEDEEEEATQVANSKKQESILAPRPLREDLQIALKLIKQATKGIQEDFSEIVPVVQEIILS